MVARLSAVIEREGLTARKHAHLMRKLNRQWASRQRYQRLPKHFEEVPETAPGSGGYRYKRRSAEYTRKKQKQKSHKRPNVYTGRLRAAVLANVKVTATQNGANLVTRGSREHRLQTWQKDEIARVSLKERKEERKRMARDYVRYARTAEYKAIRRRKVK